LHDIHFEPGRDLANVPEDGHKTPDYYQKIAKPAFASWFKLGPITETNEGTIREYCYSEIPHDPFVIVARDRIVDKRISNIAQLLNFGNVTYWVIHSTSDASTGEAGPFYSQIIPDIAPNEVISALSPRVLHISDLHFGVDHHAFEMVHPNDHNVSLASAIVSALGEDRPGLVVVSGDLTWSGRAEEFEAAQRCLDSLRSSFGLTSHHFVIIPGNHDIGWVRKDDAGSWNGEYSLASQDAKANYRAFIENWYKVKFSDDLTIGRRFFLYGGQTLDILGLNTTSLQQFEGRFAGLGQVPSLVFKRAAERFGWDKEPRATQQRWLTVHHHVLPVVAQEEAANAPFGFGMSLDAGSQLLSCGRYGVDLVVHGHQHHPYAGYINTLEMHEESNSDRGVHVLGAGSAGVTDNHLGPVRKRSFNVVDLSGDETRVRVYMTDRTPKEFRCVRQFKSTPTGWRLDQPKVGQTQND